MKWSQFNRLLYSQKIGHFLHNTRMLSLILLNEKSYNILIEIQKEPNKSKQLLNEEDYNYLLKNKIIVSEKEDEAYIDQLEYRRRVKSFETQSLHLVICPTLACNFACPYCYEQNLPSHIMQEETQEQIIDFINKNADRCNSLVLNWHGGEPLIAFRAIKEIYTKLELKSQLPIKHSAMVTNGYLLTEDICNYFNKKNLNYLQITIDGNKNTHNKTRILKNGGSSFEKIIENIDRATKLMPNCRIGIRTNIGKSNREEYVELYRELSERWKGKNCTVYHAFVLDNGLNTTKQQRDTLELTTEEKNDFTVNLAKNNIISKKSLFPRLVCNSHTCLNHNGFVIDPQGILYKCWADVGIKERSIGNLTEGIKNFRIISQFMIGTDKFADSKCLKCSYLPVCDGGCNLYRVGYQERNISYNVCEINDEGLIKYIETYLEYR
ncbi:MAG: SPASM domain-containing protein [Bacteroidaceae bacterium]|nr:SPASM domain-containing protein [Bacteroides sp.]MBQ4589848.1 SPASM domain-containing protein [Bacteroidaceae bacterium]